MVKKKDTPQPDFGDKGVRGEYVPQIDPCPFCGGTEELSHYVSEDGDDYCIYYAAIKCDACDVKMTARDTYNPYRWRRDAERSMASMKISLLHRLVKRWNRRA